MEFEWDEAKRLSNFDKHGVWFDDAIYIFEGRTVVRADPRDHGGETRFRAYGTVDGRVLAIVYTWRGDVCRVISARKANDREQRAYYAALSRVAPESDG
ncbi:BrnT family toxin [Azospirillum sp. sgz301742]